MLYKKVLLGIGLVLFLLSIPMLILDYTDNLPDQLEEIFNHRFLFGWCLKDFSYAGLIWKSVLVLGGLVFMLIVVLRKVFMYLWSRLLSS